MAINSILGNGISGIQRGLNALGKDASVVAQGTAQNAGITAPDTLGALVHLTSDLEQVESSASVIRRTDEALTSLLGG